jgi:VWFA-related protein
MACLAFATSAHAQQSAVETSRTQGAAQPGYVIRARVPLTIVDVVVTDAKGKSVHGLKQTDFTVLEDGKEMKPNSFEEHRTDEATPAAPMLVKQNLPPNTFTNVTPTPPTDGPLNVLLIDNLNTPMATQTIVKRHMLDFLDKMPAGTRMEIIMLDAHIRILQGFTDDRALLKAAVAATMPQFQRNEDPQQDPTQTDPSSLEEEADMMSTRAENQISAIKQIARFLGGMPGRKNLFWATGSVTLQFPPQPPDPDLWGTSVLYDLAPAMTEAEDLLARAHVAVYSIDSRGLQVVKFKSRKGELIFAEHGTMDGVAEKTGGKAFYNNNDLGALAAEALDSGSNYYTITYTPVNQALDTRFRTISVKVDRPGLNLVYRNGYYTVAPDITLNGKKVEKVSAMQAALMRGALDATQVLFKVTVAQAPGTEAKLPADNQPDAKQMKPPYRHFTISYSIDVHGIDFATSPDGNYRGNFEYGVRVYNADGDEIVNSVSTTISPILPPTVYRSMLRGGANASQQIDVPATGDYFLRIGVHDLASDRVGAIEVPTASIASESAPAVAGQK